MGHKNVFKTSFFFCFLFTFFYTNDAILNGEKKGDGLTTMTASLSKAKRESWNEYFLKVNLKVFNGNSVEILANLLKKSSR